MKETFAGKKDSVINITLLHPPQKLFGCWKLSPGSWGPAPPDAPSAGGVQKASARKVPPGARSSPPPRRSSSSSSSSPLAGPTAMGAFWGHPGLAAKGLGQGHLPQTGGFSITSYLSHSRNRSQCWGRAPRDIPSGHREAQAEPRQLGKPLPPVHPSPTHGAESGLEALSFHPPVTHGRATPVPSLQCIKK